MCEKCLYRKNCQFLAKRKPCKVEGCTAFKSEKELISDTVQKYKSAIIEYYSKPKYQPTKEHPIKHTQIEHLFVVLDQVEKELLEGEK